MNNGRKPTSQEMPVAGRPLLLLIDDRPSAKSVILYPYGTRFSSGNEMGRSLWNVPQRVPWFKRLSSTKWPVLALTGYAIVFGSIILLNLERVPVSGRLQFRIRSWGSQVEKDGSVSQSLENMKLYQGNDEERKVIPNEDPRVTHFRRIFEDVLSASGFQPSEWKLLCLDMPGKISSIIPFLCCR